MVWPRGVWSRRSMDPPSSSLGYRLLRTVRAGTGQVWAALRRVVGERPRGADRCARSLPACVFRRRRCAARRRERPPHLPRHRRSRVRRRWRWCSAASASSIRAVSSATPTETSAARADRRAPRRAGLGDIGGSSRRTTSITAVPTHRPSRRGVRVRTHGRLSAREHRLHPQSARSRASRRTEGAMRERSVGALGSGATVSVRATTTGGLRLLAWGGAPARTNPCWPGREQARDRASASPLLARSDREPFAALHADPVVMEHSQRSAAGASRTRSSTGSRRADRGFGLWAVGVRGGAPLSGSSASGRRRSKRTSRLPLRSAGVSRAVLGPLRDRGGRTAVGFGFEEHEARRDHGVQRSGELPLAAGDEAPREPRTADDFDHGRHPRGRPLRRHLTAWPDPRKRLPHGT